MLYHYKSLNEFYSQYDTTVAAPPNKKSPEARDAPAVATSKSNLSNNNNDIGAYVCPIPAKRRKLSIHHIGMKYTYVYHK